METCLPVADPSAPEGRLVHWMMDEMKFSSQKKRQAPLSGPWRKPKKLNVKCSREAVFNSIVFLPLHVLSQSTSPATIVGLN